MLNPFFVRGVVREQQRDRLRAAERMRLVRQLEADNASQVQQGGILLLRSLIRRRSAYAPSTSTIPLGGRR